MDMDHDVIVIGGGAAGLSAAVALARSLRSVLVVDDGEPRNATAAGVHNFLSREGTPPGDLLAAGRAEVEQYGGRVRAGRVTQAERLDDGFAVTLQDCSRVTARRLVVTTGLVDELPDAEGLRERWGRDVLHCPYCHGWEVRGQTTAVLGTGPGSVHQALLFSQLTDDLTFVTHDFEPDADARGMLAAAGVRVVEGPVRSVSVQDDAVDGLRLADGRLVPATAIVVSTYMRARSEVLTSLGVETVMHPSGFGEHVLVDEMRRTSVAGVYAAGNVVDLSAQVMGAAAAGTMAGAMANADLVMSDVRERVGA
jgi:thioredoxin reductase